MDTISFADFAKVEIRIGEVKAAEVPEGSEKVIKLTVDFGQPQADIDQPQADFEGGERTIFAGIKKWYEPGTLVGKRLPFVVNLEPKKMGALGYSQGMLMAVIHEEKAVLLEPQGEVDLGDQII